MGQLWPSISHWNYYQNVFIVIIILLSQVQYICFKGLQFSIELTIFCVLHTRWRSRFLIIWTTPPPSTQSSLSKDHSLSVSEDPELNREQDRQCAYNVTLQHFHVTFAALEEQQLFNIMSVCLYSCLSYPACKWHLLCAVLSVTCLSVPYFSTLSSMVQFLGKLLNIKCVF